MHRIFYIPVFYILILNAHAASQWELGIGMGGLSIPDYLGSGHQQTYVTPFPYFIYSGRYISVNGKGLSGTLFKSERLNLDFSVDASAAVDSDKNLMRKGMPDLDPNIQIGPSLNYIVHKNSQVDSFELMFPIRFVLAADNKGLELSNLGSHDFDRFHTEGWLFHPQINWFGKRQLLNRSWNFRVSLGPMFINQSYSDYFYSIDSHYATEDRREYSATAGYAGTRILLTFSPSLKQYWFGGFMRFDALTGSTFHTSPLVTQDYSMTVGVGFAWIFAKSDA